MTNGTGGNFTIRATNNRQFDSTSPASLFLESGKSTNGTVTVSAPLNTPSGTDVTVTIEAEDPEAADTNYIMLRFSVLNPVLLSQKILIQFIGNHFTMFMFMFTL